jgi:hypothetical protein
MIKAQRNDGAQSDSVYDALGQRVAAKVNNAWQHFVYDISGQMVAEHNNFEKTALQKIWNFNSSINSG